jgi:hypothetical protein
MPDANAIGCTSDGTPIRINAENGDASRHADSNGPRADRVHAAARSSAGIGHAHIDHAAMQLTNGGHGGTPQPPPPATEDTPDGAPIRRIKAASFCQPKT